MAFTEPLARNRGGKGAKPVEKRVRIMPANRSSIRVALSFDVASAIDLDVGDPAIALAGNDADAGHILLRKLDVFRPEHIVARKDPKGAQIFLTINLEGVGRVPPAKPMNVPYRLQEKDLFLDLTSLPENRHD